MKTIFAMLRQLPEDSAFSKVIAKKLSSGDLAKPPPDPEREAQHEREFWTPDRQLMAQVINAVREQTLVLGKWEKDPGLPIVGPSSWREDAEKPKPGDPRASNHGTSVEDVFNKMMGL